MTVSNSSSSIDAPPIPPRLVVLPTEVAVPPVLINPGVRVGEFTLVLVLPLLGLRELDHRGPSALAEPRSGDASPRDESPPILPRNPLLLTIVRESDVSGELATVALDA